MPTRRNRKPRSFHSTLAPMDFFRHLTHTLRARSPHTCLQSLFPDQTVALTDSGRSALAVIVEHLGLGGKTVALPAYVCDALLPVLVQYEITPIFLDVDEATYQPPLQAYTKEVLDRADAILLVATYGKKPEEEIVSFLQREGNLIIEDFAHRSPFGDDPMQGAARLYSLQKTLPVPDGGLAILPSAVTPAPLPRHRLSLTFIKNLLKLLPLVAPLIARLRSTLAYQPHADTTLTVTEPSRFTKAVLAAQCATQPTPAPAGRYTYCYPLRTAMPEQATDALRAHGIATERIWHQPIVFTNTAQQRYHLDPAAFPHTKQITKEIVCAPLWHIADQVSYDQYTAALHEILADPSRQ